MGTRALVLTQKERRLVSQLIARAWSEADDRRMLARPESPQEKAAQADQIELEVLQDKLRDLE